jgi:hypothetical protein
VRAFALLLASLFVGGAAQAQATPGGASLSWEAVAKSQAGQWAEYTMAVGAKSATTMRYSLVEKSAKAMALEIETQMPPIVMRMDFAANGEAWKLSRIRMKMGTGQIQEVPAPEGGADQIIKKGATFGTLVGNETIKTGAGSFDCKHYKQTTSQGEGEVWMSDKALPSGLVQTVVSGLGAKITLQSTGSGATAKIK